MKPSDVTRYLAAVLPTRRPVWMWGSPGGGKSSVTYQAGADVFPDMNYRVWEVRATEFEGVDLRGVPLVHGGRTAWALPDLWPTDPADRGILFLDELGQGEPDVQKFLAKVALDRKVGDHSLPDQVYVVAASNRAKDKAGVGKVLTHLLNRFAHVDYDIDLDDWCRWAVGAGVSGEMRAFMRFKGGKFLDQFDPSLAERAFCSPRSWHACDDIYKACPADLRQEALAGVVGPGPAAEFLTFVELYHKLPDVDAVLKNPAAAPVPSREPSVLFSLVGALSDRVKKDPNLLPAYVAYSRRLPDEFSVVAAKELPMDLMRKVAGSPDFQGWVGDLRRKGFMA